MSVARGISGRAVAGHLAPALDGVGAFEALKEGDNQHAAGGAVRAGDRSAVARRAVGNDYEVIVAAGVEAGGSVDGVADATHLGGVAAVFPVGHCVGDAAVQLVAPGNSDFGAVGSLEVEVAERVATVVLGDGEVVDEDGVLARHTTSTEGDALATAGIIGKVGVEFVVVLFPGTCTGEPDDFDAVDEGEAVVGLEHTDFKDTREVGAVGDPHVESQAADVIHDRQGDQLGVRAAGSSLELEVTIAMIGIVAIVVDRGVDMVTSAVGAGDNLEPAFGDVVGGVTFEVIEVRHIGVSAASGAEGCCCIRRDRARAAVGHDSDIIGCIGVEAGDGVGGVVRSAEEGRVGHIVDCVGGTGVEGVGPS